MIFTQAEFQKIPEIFVLCRFYVLKLWAGSPQEVGRPCLDFSIGAVAVAGLVVLLPCLPKIYRGGPVWVFSCLATFVWKIMTKDTI